MKRCNNCFSETNEKKCPYCGYAEGEYIHSINLRPGTVVGKKYIIGQLLGSGGFGNTYLAFDTEFDVKVAIKEFYPKGILARADDRKTLISVESEKANYKYGLNKFLDEAKLLQKFIALPSVVSIFDTFEENGTAYLVMEYLSGMTLEQKLSGSKYPLSEEETINIITPVLQTLDKVHRAGLIHRDISPDNIYIMDNGEIKLLDFGSARYSLGEQTKAMSVLLKHGYAPPEQYMTNGKQGPWTDIYAICATIYTMLTKEKLASSLDYVMGEIYTSVKEKNPQVSDMLNRVINKGLSTDYKSRYQSVSELLHALMSDEELPADKETAKSGKKADNITTGTGTNTVLVKENGIKKTDNNAENQSQADNVQSDEGFTHAEGTVLIDGSIEPHKSERIVKEELKVVDETAEPQAGSVQPDNAENVQTEEINKTDEAIEKEQKRQDEPDWEVEQQEHKQNEAQSLEQTGKKSRKKKGWIWGVIGGLVCVALIASYFFGIFDIEDTTYKPVPTNENGAGNNANGKVAMLFEHIIVHENLDGDKLYIENSDGSGTQVLYGSIDSKYGVEIANGRIYHVDNDSIVKMNIYTKEISCLLDNADINSCLVASDNNRLYFLRSPKDNSGNPRNNLCYIDRVNGSEITVIPDVEARQFTIDGEWIYYIDTSSGHIYRAGLDGDYKRIISHHYAWDINVSDDYVYYIDRDNDYQIMKKELSSSMEKAVGDACGQHINVIGDWIYYTNPEDKYSIYRVRIDGNENEKIGDIDNVQNINIAGNWIFYDVINPNSFGLYKMKLDGTENTKID